jgi:hypothetical protein
MRSSFISAMEVAATILVGFENSHPAVPALQRLGKRKPVFPSPEDDDVALGIPAMPILKPHHGVVQLLGFTKQGHEIIRHEDLVCGGNERILAPRDRPHPNSRRKVDLGEALAAELGIRRHLDLLNLYVASRDILDHGGFRIPHMLGQFHRCESLGAEEVIDIEVFSEIEEETFPLDPGMHPTDGFLGSQALGHR